MKVTVEQLVDFISKHGEDFNVTAKDIEFVGLDRVLSGIDHQVDSRMSKFHVAWCECVPETDPIQAMKDYFSESFDRDYDHVFSGR